MLGDSESQAFHSALMKELLATLVFPSHRLVASSSMNTLLDLLTSNQTALCEGTTLSCMDFATNEKKLWSLLQMSQPQLEEVTISVDGQAITQCMKTYRRLLTSADWKPHRLLDKQVQDNSLLHFLGMSASHKPLQKAQVDTVETDPRRLPVLALQLEEFYVSLNLMQNVCKLLLQAQHSWKKLQIAPLPRSSDLRELLRALSVGLRSDLANSLLEALTGFPFVWRRRFERRLLATLKGSLTTNNAGLAMKSAHYLRQDQPVMLAVGLLQLLCEGIPAAQSLENYMERVFNS
jgi:hypothetical protein